MRKLATLLTALSLLTASYGQELETLGEGVIDFLKSNQKTASRLNETEKAALDVISDLLNISAQRKHEMNVANAGRSEIVINTTRGNQSTLYSDNQGNLYLLSSGTIYPISQGLVSQARAYSVEPSIKNSTLPPYNLSILKGEYKFEKNDAKNFDYSEYLVERPMTLQEIAKENNVTIDDIYTLFFWAYNWGNRGASYIYDGQLTNVTKAGFTYNYMINPKEFNVIKDLNTKNINSIRKYLNLSANDMVYVAQSSPGAVVWEQVNSVKNRYLMCNGIYIRHKKFEHAIVTTFTCNWAKDFEGDGFDFDDFQGVKRSFVIGEDQLFVMGYTTEITSNWELEIYKATSGETVYKNIGLADKGGHVITVEKDGEKLPEGVYIYNFTLISDELVKVSKSEKFEIIEEANINAGLKQ